VSAELGVTIPFWLDSPDEEAIEIARAAERAGLGKVWVGEMATFDAFALATAIGQQTQRIRLIVGPLAVGVRSPVAIALGVSSVATLSGRGIDVALGASSPVIVGAWHDRPWAQLAPRTRETVIALRAILDGERIDFDGKHVRAHGFRLRRAQPGTSIAVAAFGPAMTRVAASDADEVVLNLVTADHVAAVRKKIDEHAMAAHRPAPRLAVWVPAALDPGPAALTQLAGQLSVYVGVPGYGELFAGLGFEALVDRARSGMSRRELVKEIPLKLLEQVGALGSAHELAARIDAYHEAGADHVAVAPSTAEDPGGHATLGALAQQVAS
jgi:probable F420-dependent oxidoreductase